MTAILIRQIPVAVFRRTTINRHTRLITLLCCNLWISTINLFLSYSIVKLTWFVCVCVCVYVFSFLCFGWKYSDLLFGSNLSMFKDCWQFYHLLYILSSPPLTFSGSTNRWNMFICKHWPRLVLYIAWISTYQFYFNLKVVGVLI